MAIKYLNPKSYGEVLQRLINGYKKVKGTNPQGLDLVKIKLEAMEQIRESKKIIKLPEEKITDYTKDRPTEGPKAEVKKFPTKNKPSTQTYSLDFLDLLEDFNKIKANNKKTKKSMFELMDDLQALTKEYKKTETKKITTSDFLRDYFDLPNPQGPDQKGLMKVAMDKGKKEKAEMLAMGLDPSDMKDYEKYMKIKAASKDKVTSAEDIIKDDDFDPSGMAGGGLAYLLGEEPVKMGKGGAIIEALEAALKKLGNKVTTADKIKRPESALRREMFDDFNKRNKKIDKSRKLTDDEIREYEEEIGDSETWMETGTLEEAEKALKDRKAEEAYMYAQYKMGRLDPVAGEKTRDRMKFLQKRQEEAESIKDFRLFGEDEIDELDELERRFEYLDLEDKAQNISRKMTGEEIQKLKEINDSGYVDFQKEIDKIKRNKKAYGGRIGFAQGANKKMMIVDLLNKGADLDLIKTITEASDEEIMEAVDFFKYGGAGVPLPTFDESGKMIDDGLYKGRETRPEAKAYGGRIGFSAGGIDKVRRGFLKLLGAGAGAAVTAKTGLFGLMKGGKKTTDVAKVATKVAGVAPNQPPSYLFDLVKVIRAKGKDITKANQTIERETVKIYKGVELHENPDGFRIKAEGVSPYEGGKEIELMYSKTEEVKDLGLETQKSFKVTDYEEVTVRPDPDGKMKDVEFYVDEKDHNKLKKIVEDEKKFKTGGRVSLSTGGLAKLLGE
jgi:hypothetical protein